MRKGAITKALGAKERKPTPERLFLSQASVVSHAVWPRWCLCA